MRSAAAVLLVLLIAVAAKAATPQSGVVKEVMGNQAVAPATR